MKNAGLFRGFMGNTRHGFPGIQTALHHFNPRCALIIFFGHHSIKGGTFKQALVYISHELTGTKRGFFRVEFNLDIADGSLQHHIDHSFPQQHPIQERRKGIQVFLVFNNAEVGHTGLHPLDFPTPGFESIRSRPGSLGQVVHHPTYVDSVILVVVDHPWRGDLIQKVQLVDLGNAGIEVN